MGPWKASSRGFSQLHRHPLDAEAEAIENTQWPLLHQVGKGSLLESWGNLGGKNYIKGRDNFCRKGSPESFLGRKMAALRAHFPTLTCQAQKASLKTTVRTSWNALGKLDIQALPHVVQTVLALFWTSRAELTPQCGRKIWPAVELTKPPALPTASKTLAALIRCAHFLLLQAGELGCGISLPHAAHIPPDRIVFEMITPLNWGYLDVKWCKMM